MIIQWIFLCIIVCFLAFSYIKQFSLKSRLTFLVTVFVVSLILALLIPIFKISIITLLALFFIENIWLLLALVLFIDMIIGKKNKVTMIVLAIVCLTIYFYLRTMI
ncbi:hypothetical protein [Clostridium sp. UBA4548]|uniref:hypothetical protein n=1 Tax=Clostridium sp. UBA4548 TaxID=1946361 RepID=UPI0025BC7098|nr:hypothetical protein [Clostridium sp. UBA4548]